MYAFPRSLVAATLAATAALGLLAGCGGGSDDDTGIPANTPYNVRAAVANLLGTGGSWTVQGTGTDNVAYQFTWRMTPTTRGAFGLDGVTYDRTVQSFTVRQGGGASSTEDTTLFHNLTTVTLAGARDADGNCSRFSASATLPTAAIAGDSGSFYQTDDYRGCTAGTAPTSSSATRWSVEMGNGRPYLCLTTTSTAGGGREIDCVQIESNGALGSRARVRLDIPQTNGSTLVIDAVSN
jgi:hypothetical protein